MSFLSRQGESVDANKASEVKILKAVLWIYIIMCLAIAGLNYGYAGRASACGLRTLHRQLSD